MEFIAYSLSPLLSEGVFSIVGSGEAPVPLTSIAANCTNLYALTLASSVKATYADRPVLSARNVALVGDLSALTATCQSPYHMFADCSASNLSKFDVLTMNLVSASNLGRYDLASDSIQSILNLPVLTLGSTVLEHTSAEVSCDESSPYWILKATLAHLSDYASISIGDEITLAVGALVISMVVDGKSFQRSIADDGRSVTETPTISGISPLALRDSPFASTSLVSYSVDTLASVVVQDQIGTCVWSLPDWTISASALAFADATPLAIATEVVESIGGVIESAPDGTPVCRKKYPVNIPDYYSTGVDVSFPDTAVLEVEETIAPVDGFNRVTITNDPNSTSSGSDTIEKVEVEGDLFTKIIRAYPSPVRKVKLVHSGKSGTKVVALGVQTRTETETVEFKSGKATTQYRVAKVISTTWNSSDLGEVSVSGYDLTSAVESYSLLEITYAVESVDFIVTSPDINEVQFYLVDA